MRNQKEVRIRIIPRIMHDQKSKSLPMFTCHKDVTDDVTMEAFEDTLKQELIKNILTEKDGIDHVDFFFCRYNSTTRLYSEKSEEFKNVRNQLALNVIDNAPNFVVIAQVHYKGSNLSRNESHSAPDTLSDEEFALAIHCAENNIIVTPNTEQLHHRRTILNSPISKKALTIGTAVLCATALGCILLLKYKLGKSTSIMTGVEALALPSTDTVINAINSR